MRAVVNGWEMSELLRAAERSRAKRDGGRRFARTAQRVLDEELVRAIELQSGRAIEEHMVAVLGAWNGHPEALGRTLAAHVHALGLPLVVEAPDEAEEEDDDDADLGTGEHPYVQRLRARGTWMLTAGLVLAALGGITLLLSLALALASVEGRWSGLVCFVAATLPLASAALALSIGGARRRARAVRLRDLEGLALSHARLPIHVLERELRVAPSDLRALLREALAHGVVEGRLDVEDGVLVSAMADARVGHEAARCTTCGAESAALRAPGIAGSCPYCGARIRR